MLACCSRVLCTEHVCSTLTLLCGHYSRYSCQLKASVAANARQSTHSHCLWEAMSCMWALQADGGEAGGATCGAGLEAAAGAQAKGLLRGLDGKVT